jgi:hypothetical protein
MEVSIRMPLSAGYASTVGRGNRRNQGALEWSVGAVAESVVRTMTRLADAAASSSSAKAPAGTMGAVVSLVALASRKA